MIIAFCRVNQTNLFGHRLDSMVPVGREFYETTSYIPVFILYETPGTERVVLEKELVHILNDSVGLKLAEEKSNPELPLLDYSSTEGE